MPALKRPVPDCPACGRSRIRRRNGKLDCLHCNRIAAKIRYAVRMGKPLPEEQLLGENRERVQCECGEWFVRSTANEVIATRCHRCRCTNSATDPTPEEIQVRCAEIQAEWTDQQRRQRLDDRYEHYEIPQMSSACLLPGGMDDRDCFNF